MKKLLLFGLAIGFSLTGKAQMVGENAVIIDAAEDTTQITTINDIIVMQEMVNKRNTTDEHINSVWSRKSYFNPGYVSSTLASKDPIYLNNSTKENLSFKSDWGAQIELGHSYTLHKGAIANMVQINLDYTFIDLTVNHYKEDKKIYDQYDATQYWTNKPGEAPSDGSSSYNRSSFEYLPWGADKYDLTYGMSLGPSITLAPFTPLSIRGLHFLKFNVYYHVGYNFGLMFMDHREIDPDSKDKKSGMTFDYITWGHGLSTSFGLSLSWKSIGIGWETRTTNLKYKPFSTGDYGDFESKFKNSSSRIYLSIKY